jgi:hypothetical protein
VSPHHDQSTRLRVAPGLHVLNGPAGATLEVPHASRRHDPALLRRPGVLAALLHGEHFVARRELEAILARDGGVSVDDAARVIDQLVADELMIAEDDRALAAEAEAYDAWQRYNWGEPFVLQWQLDRRARDRPPNDRPPGPRVGAPRAPRARIALPRDTAFAHPSIWELLTLEQEHPNEANHPDRGLGLDELAWMTERAFGRPGIHATYLLVIDVAGLAPGAYRYAAADHALELIRTGDFDRVIDDHMIRKASFFPPFPHRVAYVTTVDFEGAIRAGVSYRDVHRAAGHDMESIRLLARARDRNFFRGYVARESVLEPLLEIDGLDEATLAYSIVG